MRLSASERIEQDEAGRFLCPACSWPYASALSAATCDCDD